MKRSEAEGVRPRGFIGRAQASPPVHHLCARVKLPSFCLLWRQKEATLGVIQVFLRDELIIVIVVSDNDPVKRESETLGGEEANGGGKSGCSEARGRCRPNKMLG